MEVTLTKNGYFVLEKSLMEHLGVKPGQKVAVVRTPEGGIALSAAKNKTSMEEMFSRLELLRAGRDFKPLEIQEMNKSISRCYAQAGRNGLK